MNQNVQPYRWVLCWVLSVLILQIYGHIDNRPLVDLGRYYQSIPDWWVFFDTWNLQMLSVLSTQFAGWLNALLAFWTWMGGQVEVIFAGYAIVTSGLFWWSVRDQTSLSLIFLMMQPIWQVGWRTQWIHALETSLMLMVWQGCRSNQSRVWIGMLSMCAVWLRPSAIIWLTILCLWNLRHQYSKGIHRAIGVGTLFGVMMIWPNLREYVFGKILVPQIEIDWLDQIGRHSGVLPTVLMIGIWVWYGARKLKNEDWMYITWMLTGTMLAMFFGVGLDNFPLIFVGLALFCGRTIELKSIQWGVASICAALNVLPFIDSMPSIFSVLLHPNVRQETRFDFQRPIQKGGEIPAVQDVYDVIESRCRQIEPHCVVVTTGSLFHPHRESHGRLALLYPALKHLKIEKAELWYRRPQQLVVVDVAILQQCTESTNVWPIHFRTSALEFTQQVQNWSKKEVLSAESCSWTFFVPPSSQENR